MRRKLVAAMAVLAGLMTLPAPAMADMPAGTISTFNEAVQTGDAVIVVAAAKALGATAIAHPEDPQAAVAAFEAANQLCLRGACGDAMPMAEYLAGLETGLPASRAEVEILHAFATWVASDGGKAADAAFSEVLGAHAGTPPSMLTLAAYEYYAADLAGSDDWAAVRERAALAVSHEVPVRDVVPRRWAAMALLSASAQFNRDRSTDALQEVADIESYLYRKRYVEDVENLEDVYYQASAWRQAMMAFFTSVKGRDFKIARRIDAQADAVREELNDLAKADGDDAEGPPLCTGHVVTPPRPTYPRDAARKGYVGAVILGFDFVDGAPGNYRVLASVPDGQFEQTSLDGMKYFKWEWDAQQEDPGCTKAKEAAGVYPFNYALR